MVSPTGAIAAPPSALRPIGFATNTLWWAPQIRADGVVRGPYGAAARSLIHERDIAAVAVRALTGDGHGGAKYLLTGPQSLTQFEYVRTIGEAIGRPLRYEEISPEVARQQMLTDMPPSIGDGILNYYAKLVTEPEPVSPTDEGKISNGLNMILVTLGGSEFYVHRIDRK